MAYKKSYASNPDALPPSLEPDQVAAMMSQSSISSRPAPAPAPTGRRPVPGGVNRPPQPRYSQDGSKPLPVRTSSSSTTGRYSGASPTQPMASSPSSYSYNNSVSQSRPTPPPRQSVSSPRPQSNAPPSGPTTLSRDDIWPLFTAVDTQRNGQLSEQSLGRALVNADYTAFDAHTVKMMIRMFDTDHSGTISFDEFVALWGFLSDWRKLFERFDVDRSGNISRDEFGDALTAFGYTLSKQFVDLLFGTFARPGQGAPNAYTPPEMCLSFDLFVQACISLRRMTDVFKKYDEDRDGYITLSFEQFLTGAQSLFLFNSISPTTDRGRY